MRDLDKCFRDILILIEIMDKDIIILNLRYV